jgi:hypothetical protein
MSSKKGTTKRLTFQDRKMLDYEEPALSILAGHKPSVSAKKEAVVELTDIKKESFVDVGTKKKVAIVSERNITWQEVGKVYRGLNLVDEDAAQKWLTRSSIRLATEKEIHKEFN